MLVYNTSLISVEPQRDDITYVPIPATDLATELGNVKMANMAALGALVAATGILPLMAVIQSLTDHLPPDKRDLLALNEQALRRGALVAAPLVS